MATNWTLRIAAEPSAEVAQAAHEAFLILQKLEKLLSKFGASSDISRVNSLKKNEKTWLQAETFECLKSAQNLAQKTNRAFDAAAGTLVDFWKKQRKTAAAGTTNFCAEMPEWREAFENFRFGTFALDEISHEILCVSEGAKIDLGGIGKGFAAKKIAEFLKSWGFEKILVSAGGSTIFALDAPENSPGWKIGFSDEIPAPFFLKNQAISSSGTAFQNAHIVDPRNGLLAISKEKTLRVLAENPAAADALSTALFVMNPSERASFLAENPDVKIL